MQYGVDIQVPATGRKCDVAVDQEGIRKDLDTGIIKQSLASVELHQLYPLFRNHSGHHILFAIEYHIAIQIVEDKCSTNLLLVMKMRS